MKATMLIAFTIAVLLSVVLSTAAQAQTGASVSFKGIEISAGHQDLVEAYGWICYAKTSGDLPGSLTVSMDYEGAKGPSAKSLVTGGAWTLPVYEQSTFANVRTTRIDSYQGLVFGSVDAGAITWNEAGTIATVELKLLIRGGTQAMSDLSGTAVLYGTVNYTGKGTATFSGSIYFELK